MYIMKVNFNCAISRVRKFISNINPVRFSALVTFIILFLGHRVNIDSAGFSAFQFLPHEIIIAQAGILLCILLVFIKKIASKGTLKNNQVITIEEIDNALKKNQFELYLQPKKRLIDNKVTGAECLIRWNHPSYGIIHPDSFIHILENSNSSTMKNLTYYVINQAANIYNQLKKHGYDLELSVNVSPDCLTDNNIVKVIKKALSHYKMPHQKLMLEITENVIINDISKVDAIMHEINSVGVSISIDDFGTGHASYVYLKLFPIKEIKIDKTFTSKIYVNENEKTIVKSIIQLSHDIGARVVAEGVETAIVRNILDEMHCDYIQGYLIARPLVLEQFVRWLDVHVNNDNTINTITE
jgi:EAL domain-containing protein (putative c-di-GMP-specific phosphodiesterase class I)